MSNNIPITNPRSLDRMRNTVLMITISKMTTVYDMRNKHVQRVIFQTDSPEDNIINSSRKMTQVSHTNRVEMHINTDIGKNETIEASQYIC